jgi:hypothetical protein
MCVSRCSSYGLTAYRDRRRRDPISAATPLGAAGARTTSLTGNFGCDGKRSGRAGQGRSGNLANRSTSVLRGRTNRRRRLGTLGGWCWTGRTATWAVGTWCERRAGDAAEGGGAIRLRGGTLPAGGRARAGLISRES